MEGRGFSPAEREGLNSLPASASAQFVSASCAEGETGYSRESVATAGLKPRPLVPGEKSAAKGVGLASLKGRVSLAEAKAVLMASLRWTHKSYFEPAG